MLENIEDTGDTCKSFSDDLDVVSRQLADFFMDQPSELLGEFIDHMDAASQYGPRNKRVLCQVKMHMIQGMGEAGPDAHDQRLQLLKSMSRCHCDFYV